MKILFRLGIVLTIIWILTLTTLSMQFRLTYGLEIFVMLGLLIPIFLWGCIWIFSAITNKKPILIIILCLLGILALIFIGEKIKTYLSTSHKAAILNAKWGMSPDQIEKANNTILSKPKPKDLLFPVIYGVSDFNRFEQLQQSNIFVYDNLRADITYDFLDKKLFKYVIRIKINQGTNESQAIKILNTIKKKYGNGKRVPNKNTKAMLSYEWVTKDKKISLSLYKETNTSQSLFIRGLYFPIYREIQKTSKENSDPHI